MQRRAFNILQHDRVAKIPGTDRPTTDLSTALEYARLRAIKLGFRVVVRQHTKLGYFLVQRTEEPLR